MATKKYVIGSIGGAMILAQTLTAFAATPSEISLDDSVALALKNNPAVKIAVQDQEKSNWSIKEAEAGKLPTLSLGLSSTRMPGAASGEPGTNYNTSLKLNWTLYSGGRLEGLIDQAKLNADNSDLGVTKAQQQVKLDATTAYYNVLQAANMVKVNQETVDSLTEHLKSVQAQFAAGTVAKSDVLRSEVELANAQQNFTKAQNAYDVAIASLNNVMGEPLDTERSLKDELAYTEFTMSLDESIEYALQHRPDIFQSKNSVTIAEQGVNIAESGFRPTITMGASDGWSGNEFPGQANNWSVNVMANWNVFDSGITKAKVKQAEAGVDKAIQQDVQTRNGVQLEVRQNYMNMKEAEKRLQTTKVAVDKATEDLKIAKTKYYAGVGTNLDVIDAQLALTQAKTNNTQALYDYNLNKAKLEKSMGL
ncbi:Outer membrane protein TolC [Sporomusa carbonis]|uniref:TolC family protein n=1 Tax=Sporomusa carbonis TaxID=3076075 RepID=UPI003A73139C